MPDTVLISTPFWSAIVAKVWRRSWNRILFRLCFSRNSLNLTGQFVIGALQTVVGIATENPEGVISGVVGAFGVAKQMYDHKLTPDSSRGNINGADINMAQDQNGFYFYKKSIKKEFAKIIDDFLTKFGYKVAQSAFWEKKVPKAFLNGSTKAINGLMMLVSQAVYAQSLWNGEEVKADIIDKIFNELREQ